MLIHLRGCTFYDSSGKFKKLNCWEISFLGLESILHTNKKPYKGRSNFMAAKEVWQTLPTVGFLNTGKFPSAMTGPVGCNTTPAESSLGHVEVELPQKFIFISLPVWTIRYYDSCTGLALEKLTWLFTRRNLTRKVCMFLTWSKWSRNSTQHLVGSVGVLCNYFL